MIEMARSREAIFEKTKFHHLISFSTLQIVISISVFLPFFGILAYGTEYSASLKLSTDRRFVYQFFRYFPLVRARLSAQCLAATDYFRNHSTDEWAIKLIDSNSMIEPGIAAGNLQYLGSFDECVHLRIPMIANGGDDDHSILTERAIQYCSVTFPISMILSPNQLKKYPPSVLPLIPPFAGICLPAACDAKTDLPAILNKYSEMSNNSVSVMNCVTEADLAIGPRIESTHFAIFTIVLIIVILCAAGTGIDAHKSKDDRRRTSNILVRFLLCFSYKRNFDFLFSGNNSQPKKNNNRITEKIEQRQQKAITVPFATPGKWYDSTSTILSSNLSLISSGQQSSTSTSSPPPPHHNPLSANLGATTVAITTEDHDRERETPTPRVVTPTAPDQIEPNRNSSSSSRPQIDCLHGIRFISFAFILIYHTFTEAQVPSVNILELFEKDRSFTQQLVTNAALWVDTFFLLSGFLVAHSEFYSKSADASSSALDRLRTHAKRVLHRYLRLTPSVAGVLMLSIAIEPLGSGPVWYQYVSLSRLTCHRNWWTIFLYVNNYVNLNQANQAPSECLGYLWYLAVDMQFFLISPLLIAFLANRNQFRTQMIGVAINLAAIIGSSAITAALIITHNLTPTILVTVYDLSHINLVYKAAYCRIGPYCVGILLAYVLHRRRTSKNEIESTPQSPQQFENRKYSKISISIVQLIAAIGLMLTATLLTYPWLRGADYRNSPLAVAYGATNRTVWSIGWAILIALCVTQKISLVDRFLSLPLFRFLSKLTYQSYLVHSVLISAVLGVVRNKIFFSEINFILDIFKYLLLTILVSIGTFVTFERPFINLEQTFIKW